MIVSQRENRSGLFYTHRDTDELLEQLGADIMLDEDLGRRIRKVLDTRQDARP